LGLNASDIIKLNASSTKEKLDKIIYRQQLNTLTP
jgi:hypothetical protein